MGRHTRRGVLRIEAHELGAHALVHHGRHQAEVAASVLDGDQIAYRLRDPTCGKGGERLLHRWDQPFVGEHPGDLRVGDRSDHKYLPPALEYPKASFWRISRGTPVRAAGRPPLECAPCPAGAAVDLPVNSPTARG